MKTRKCCELHTDLAVAHKCHSTLWTVNSLEQEMDYPASVERIVQILNAYEEMPCTLKLIMKDIISGSLGNALAVLRCALAKSKEII